MKKLILAIVSFLIKGVPGYHIHKDPRKKGKPAINPLFNLPPPKEEDKCQPETCAGQCQGMNSRPECPNILKMEKEMSPPKTEEKE